MSRQTPLLLCCGAGKVCGIRYRVSSQVAQPGPTTQKVRQDLEQERARVGGGGGGGGVAKPRAAAPPALGGDAVAVPYRRVRVCGNRGCGNFAGAAEASLELKQCGGCKAGTCT